MKQDLVRISLMVRKDQHNQLNDMGVNISGYIRDRIDDDLNSNTITLAVNEELKSIYDQIISNSGEGDRELQPYIKKALRELLTNKIEHLKKLQKNI